MNQTEARNAVPRPETKPVLKKPYLKPEVRHERIFETNALACGKVQGTSHTCNVNRRSS